MKVQAQLNQLGHETGERLTGKYSSIHILSLLRSSMIFLFHANDTTAVADLGGGRWGQLPPLHDGNSALAPPF